jgi:hypothetical protein
MLIRLEEAIKKYGIDPDVLRRVPRAKTQLRRSLIGNAFVVSFWESDDIEEHLAGKARAGLEFCDLDVKQCGTLIDFTTYDP